ncbi:hypothetical protein, partial [Desulfovibrio sp.]|uniref:hypothetical protein n=1 Tax=Desulfovibrio sp. TaxID=885 RepID=UPI0025BA1015
CWLRQRKISSVEYLSTLPSEIFIFLASPEKSYFLGFFRHQHPSFASLQTELRKDNQLFCITAPPRNAGA